MNSLPWVGKIIGCFLSDWLIDRGGYKVTMYVAACVQIVGVVREFSQPPPLRPCLPLS